MFFNAHIISHINFASTIWDGCSQDTFIKLNSVYRRAVKQLDNRQISTDEKLKQLNILPLRKQLNFNKTILTHKIYYKKHQTTYQTFQTKQRKDTTQTDLDHHFRGQTFITQVFHTQDLNYGTNYHNHLKQFHIAKASKKD